MKQQWILVVLLLAVAAIPAIILGQVVAPAPLAPAAPAPPVGAAPAPLPPAPAAAVKPKGVFAVLKPGDRIVLRDLGPSYELTIAGAATPPGYEVVEVDTDYVVIKDLAGMNFYRIPVYSVKAIRHFKIDFGDRR